MKNFKAFEIMMLTLTATTALLSILFVIVVLNCVP